MKRGYKKGCHIANHLAIILKLIREREMGRRPCCSKVGLNRGAWTKLEDQILKEYINVNGEGNWNNLPNLAGN